MAITSTKYRIMLVVSNKDQFGSLYKYLTITDTDGTVKPYETDSLAELDAKVESMLNGEYKKNDFIIVKAFDYDVLADIDTAEEVSGQEKKEGDFLPEGNRFIKTKTVSKINNKKFTCLPVPLTPDDLQKASMAQSKREYENYQVHI